MILQIPLQAYPNQRTSVIVNSESLTIELKTIENGFMYANVYLNSDLIICGAKCNAGISLNQYVTKLKGHLTWWTQDGYDPVWENIGTTAFLLYTDYPLEKQLYNKFVGNNNVE